MRKILLSIIVCGFLIATAFFMVNGLQKINTQGFKGIDEKNTIIEEKIANLENIINVTYANTLSNLKSAANTLSKSKTEYEAKAIALNSENTGYASHLEPYDIDYLWTKLGNYAKDENVVIKIDVTVSGVSSKLYDLNFTVNGDYVNTTDFIYDIENDSKLGFRIDNFKMVASTDNVLQATFTCADIPIDLKKIDASSNTYQSTDTTTTTNETNTNTTNSSANTTSSNTGSSVAESYMGNNLNPNKSNLTNDEYAIKTNTGE